MRSADFLKSLFDTLIVLLGVSTLVFFLLALVPGDPVDVMLGESAQTADREAMRAALGLDKPVLQRWWEFHLGLMQFDLGQSIFRNQPVSELIAQRFPATALLAISAFALMLIISIPLGLLAANKAGRWQDRAASVFSLFGLSIPNFWLGPMLVLVFSIWLAWTPVSGMDSPLSLVLPAVTLGISMAAISTRMVRSSVLETLSQAYIQTAKAKGLDASRVLIRHALANALLPVLTLFGLQLGGLLAGAVITEVVFAWPGIGGLLIDAIQQRDFPVVQGVVLVIAFSYVFLNLLTDLIASFVDPRIRKA